MTETVLVVDDDAGIRELLKFKLAGDGVDVEACANGRDCIDSLRTGALPSVVLLDVRMPGMDGHEVLETIRTEFETPPPVVLLTGAQPRSDADTAAAERIEKPFTIAEVQATVDRVLGE